MPNNVLSIGDGTTALLALIGLGGLIGLGEGLRRWGAPAATTRRLVHVGVGLFVAVTPLVFTRPLPVYGLAVVFIFVNITARTRHWWAGIHEARPESWGTVALPLSVLPAMALTWSADPDRLVAFQVAYLVLALADPAASWVGERRGPEASLGSSTVRGSLTFAAIAFGVAASMLLGSREWALPYGFAVATGTTLVATLVETISRQGWDNFFVVIAIILVMVPIQEGVLSIMGLGGGLVLGAGFGGLAYWSEALDARGAVAGGLFAVSLVALGGSPWVVPGVVFFGLSSLLTGLTERGQSTETMRRTQGQVLANGGVAWVALAVAAAAPSLKVYSYVAFVGALAAAAADTWATELGQCSSRPPWSLREGRRVPVGTSGAVSVAGTAAALAGAGSVVGAALWMEGPLTAPTGSTVLLLLGAGLAGMGADSAAGAFLQARYRMPGSDALVENPPSERRPVQGWSGIHNNVVNVIGTTTGAVAALLGFGAMG
mgnify:CR=1 FL=1